MGDKDSIAAIGKKAYNVASDIYNKDLKTENLSIKNIAKRFGILSNGHENSIFAATLNTSATGAVRQ